MGEFRFVGEAVLHAKAMRALSGAVGKAAEDLQGRAQAAAPVDTGTLRASIHVEGPSAGASANSVVAKVKTGGEANEYAVFQHEGTSRGVPATKFLERPLIELAPAYRAFLEAEVRAAFG